MDGEQLLFYIIGVHHSGGFGAHNAVFVFETIQERDFSEQQQGHFYFLQYFIDGPCHHPYGKTLRKLYLYGSVVYSSLDIEKLF